MRALVFRFALVMIALVATAPAARVSALDAAAIRAANARFAGVWKLVGEETRDPQGNVVPGPNAASGGRFGFITYDPAGYVGVVLAWNKRPAFAGKASTAQEAGAALASYNSYWGSFAVNDAKGVVTHQVMGAVNPAFAG